MNRGYPRYLTVAERRARAEQSLEALREKNPQIAPVRITGTKLATTWWGKAWNQNLENYADYAYRIGRGRSYVRHGAVLDLTVRPGKVAALVQGSQGLPYRVDIAVSPLSSEAWQKITTAFEGAVSSLQELLDGRLPQAMAAWFTAPGEGLFPSPQEISLRCSCPDYAVLCKHVAAALYGIGARLDQEPSLFFELRQVRMEELVSQAIREKSRELLSRSTEKSARILDRGADGLEAMFGIDLDSPGG